MDPLVITATPNISWLHPEIPYPRTPDEFAAEARRCRDAGAAVLHAHAEGQWAPVIDAVRAECDLVVQCGMSSLPIPERLGLFEGGADMASIILSHHDEAFAETECLVLHPREELEEYAALCDRYDVVPEWEVWHAGSIWNLRYLIDRGLLHPPHVVTMFFGWPGGTWSPPTVEEYRYRRRLLPDDCVATVSIMGEHQVDVVAAAIVAGDHVRVGTEDLPFDRTGTPAATHALVAQAAALAAVVGRPVASPDEARKMLGIRRQP
ncbi:MAG: 3-keto-5-aminohexanoate cleavage protein [Acidimicrobiia bacterium]